MMLKELKNRRLKCEKYLFFMNCMVLIFFGLIFMVRNVIDEVFVFVILVVDFKSFCFIFGNGDC